MYFYDTTYAHGVCFVLLQMYFSFCGLLFAVAIKVQRRLGFYEVKILIYLNCFDVLISIPLPQHPQRDTRFSKQKNTLQLQV